MHTYTIERSTVQCTTVLPSFSLPVFLPSSTAAHLVFRNSFSRLFSILFYDSLSRTDGNREKEASKQSCKKEGTKENERGSWRKKERQGNNSLQGFSSSRDWSSSSSSWVGGASFALYLLLLLLLLTSQMRNMPSGDRQDAEDERARRKEGKGSITTWKNFLGEFSHKHTHEYKILPIYLL